MVDFAQMDANGFVRKLAYIDLMKIKDPEIRARQTGDRGKSLQGRFSFQFCTIETMAWENS